MIERLTSAGGAVFGLAIDHRDSLRTAAARRGVPTDHATLAAFKADVVAALAGRATVVLLDLELGQDAIERLPAGLALVMPLEEQGYESVADGRVTTLLPAFSPEQARDLGAVGCKLLLPYHAGRPHAAKLQDDVARHALELCRAAGIGLVLEPIVDTSGDVDTAGGEGVFADAVAEGARRLAALRPDLLKLQFPAGSSDDERACRALTRACGEVPWVLLGGGSDAATFLGQLQVACRAGARGFIAGRTVWDAALTADARARERALAEVCAPLLARAAEIALACDGSDATSSPQALRSGARAPSGPSGRGPAGSS